MAPSNDKEAASPNNIDTNLFDDTDEENANKIVKIKEETQKESPIIVASILDINEQTLSPEEK